MSPELTTVADDEAVLHHPATEGAPARAVRVAGLEPDSEYEAEGVTFRTLPRPAGERLSTLATVNDLHFGETLCGVIAGTDVGPVLASVPGEPPYPETMNRAAVAEIAAMAPAADLVLAKGDLTDAGKPGELEDFVACYGVLGERLVAVPGNHDVNLGPAPFGSAPFERRPPFSIELPGAVVAVIGTPVDYAATGRVGADQLEWLDDLAAAAEGDGRTVLVFGHHHPWDPGSRTRPDNYFGIHPDDSEALVAVAARRPAIAAYFAGHTHRNRVRHFEATGAMPWVEVAAVKEFPGCWAEYRVYEGGVMQVLRRTSSPDALEWSERTRALWNGTYTDYAFGRLEDRCFVVAPRRV
ncbi:MAG TPA: metallophosphoesterase [Acidimicrobiales bacterium]|nr:metallophosphoesterase [Acidimicrobiales bacterium]